MAQELRDLRHPYCCMGIHPLVPELSIECVLVQKTGAVAHFTAKAQAGKSPRCVAAHDASI